MNHCEIFDTYYFGNPADAFIRNAIVFQRCNIIIIKYTYRLSITSFSGTRMECISKTQTE